MFFRIRIARYALTLLLLGSAAAVDATPNLSLQLRCAAEVFKPSDPVRCILEWINHQDRSHVVYVPESLYPVTPANWPEALLLLDLRRDGSREPLRNKFLDAGTVDVAAFSEGSLQPLDIGRLIGWELDLRSGYYWQFDLRPGRYSLRARVKVGILDEAKRSRRVKDALAKTLGRSAARAEALVVNGEFESNLARFTVE